MKNTDKMQERILRLMPDGIPRYVRCYDNGGETADQYTVVYTGRYAKTRGWFDYVAMSSNPFHPCRVGIEFTPIDRPTYSHLGRRIKFLDLPRDCRKLVMHHYCENWELSKDVVFYADGYAHPELPPLHRWEYDRDEKQRKIMVWSYGKWLAYRISEQGGEFAAYVSEKGGEEEVLAAEEFKILAFCACERDFLTR